MGPESAFYNTLVKYRIGCMEVMLRIQGRVRCLSIAFLPSRAPERRSHTRVLTISNVDRTATQLSYGVNGLPKLISTAFQHQKYDVM